MTGTCRNQSWLTRQGLFHNAALIAQRKAKPHTQLWGMHRVSDEPTYLVAVFQHQRGNLAESSGWQSSRLSTLSIRTMYILAHRYLQDWNLGIVSSMKYSQQLAKELLRILMVSYGRGSSYLVFNK